MQLLFEAFGKHDGEGATSAHTRIRKHHRGDEAMGGCLEHGGACTGTFIDDVQVGAGDAHELVHRCIEKCRARPSCRCVTWMKRHSHDAPCRLMTGGSAEDRDRPDLYAARVIDKKCDDDWIPHSHVRR